MAQENDDDYIFGQFYKAIIVEILDKGIMVSLKPGARPILMRNSALSNVPVGHASALGLQVYFIIFFKHNLGESRNYC